MEIDKFTITENDKIITALEKIQINKKGFLIVVDNMNIVKGTLTDGDLRRAFISKNTIHSSIKEIYNRKEEYIYKDEGFDKVINLFKSERINFLPIVDKSKKLINIITKKNMHILLMEDKRFDLSYDFLSIDDNLLDHEIYNKPWGFYKTTFLNPYSQAKIIKINPKGELSLQEHKKREEHWIVICGKGILTLCDSIKKVKPGEYIYIPKGCRHRIINLSDKNSLMIAEIQLGSYFGEDDIIRYEDIYGRV